MSRILYLTNIEVPYRVRFFNELAKYCNLTVLYETQTVEKRNEEWARSEECRFRVKYLQEKKIGSVRMDASGILREISSDYDAIVIGCYNDPVQMLAHLFMRMWKIPYFINLDGEPFLSGTGLKTLGKRFFLAGAVGYLTAGEESAESLKRVCPNAVIQPYYFSSLTEEEIEKHRSLGASERNNTVLVVGQYYDYKGMDVALEAAMLDPTIQYKFVGMGSRTALFEKEHEIPDNVEIIPFLQKQDLEREYRSCGVLVLPSRQECWGLVINEAASFGMPIVSTWGSGAAVEFLANDYPQFLAKPGDPKNLLQCIHRLWEMKDKDAYSAFLIEKSKRYSIERSVQEHLRALGISKE